MTSSRAARTKRILKKRTPYSASGISKRREYWLAATVLQPERFWVLQRSGGPLASCWGGYAETASPRRDRTRMSATPIRFILLEYALCRPYASKIYEEIC